jgi:hypothetical protein
MMNRLAIFIIFMLNTPACLWGQDRSNPFELWHRLPLMSIDGLPQAPENPFDVAPHRAPGINESIAGNATVIFNPFAILPRGGGLPNSVLLTVMVLIVGVLTLSVSANRSAVGKA